MILKLDQLSKKFLSPSGSETFDVLTNLNLDVPRGETLAILGQSGSGKSTLLSLIAGLDQPSSGEVYLNGQAFGALSEAKLARFRAQNIGIIFQQFHLMPHLTAQENVALPLELHGSQTAPAQAKQALEQVGLHHRAHHFPYQLSGGECQRVAIARALVVQPALLLADEPTGNLDHKTGDHISDLLFNLVQATGMTMVLVTHNHLLAQRCQRQVTLVDGVLQ